MEKIIGKPELFIHMGADWNQVEKNYSGADS